MYKRVLFAADFDEVGILAAHKAKKIADENGADLILVHVVEPMPGYSYAYLGIEDIEGQLIDEAKAALSKLGATLAVDPKDQYIEVGPTKSKILKIADDTNADLIICGSHGRHGLSLLLGSTANAILHGAKCDVLTVRLPEE